MPAPPRPTRLFPACWLFLLVLCQIASAGWARAQQASAETDDLFSTGAWHLELGIHAATEAWNFNDSRENLLAGSIGATYGLVRSLALVFGAPVYYVQQRGPDAWLLGGTLGVRWRILEGRRAAMYFDFQVGVSGANEETPPGGTRFNYLAITGVGITSKLSRNFHLLSGIQWLHVSNHGRAGPNRNPDIEALGPRFSILTRF